MFATWGKKLWMGLGEERLNIYGQSEMPLLEPIDRFSDLFDYPSEMERLSSMPVHWSIFEEESDRFKRWISEERLFNKEIRVPENPKSSIIISKNEIFIQSFFEKQEY